MNGFTTASQAATKKPFLEINIKVNDVSLFVKPNRFSKELNKCIKSRYN